MLASNIFIPLLLSKLDNEALFIQQFELFLKSIRDGSLKFSQLTDENRLDIFKIGNVIDKSYIPSILNKLSEYNTVGIDNRTKEMYSFLKCEFLYAYDRFGFKNEILNIINEFPFNIDIVSCKGHYKREEKDFLGALHEYNTALQSRKDDKITTEHIFNCELDHINSQIDKSNFDEAFVFCSDLIKSKKYASRFYVFHNMLISILQRISDHKKNESKWLQIDEKINKKLETERVKVVEILGFFSAIVAFILSTVNLSKSEKLSDNIYFLSMLGLVLISFCIILTVLFREQKKKNLLIWLIALSTAVAIGFSLLFNKINDMPKKIEIPAKINLKPVAYLPIEP